jgi:hypothetical protein
MDMWDVMMDAKDAALAVKSYFEDTRTSKYFNFEPGPVKFESNDGHGQWIVFCEVKDLFDSTIKKFKVTVSDEDGAILDVEKLE